MRIAIAVTADEIRRCFPVMVELRPHLTAERFHDQVTRQADAGYALAFVEAASDVTAVAGFRIPSHSRGAATCMSTTL